MQGKPHALIIVQNLSVPYDRRVWLECNSLVDAGFSVSVICPRAKGDKKKETINEVNIYRYKSPPATSGVLSFFIEFSYCFIRTFILSFKINRKHKVDVIQSCNPPDTYWLLAKYYKVFGATFVFDQHDLCPEIFDARFTNQSRLYRILRSALLFLEKQNYKTANQVISTNESYRDIAIQRGKVDPSKITVVRSGPNPEKLFPEDPEPSLYEGFKHLIVYIGVMGPQDRVDIAIDAMNYIVKELKREDIKLVLLGDGDCFDKLKQQTSDYELDEYIEFLGRAGDDTIRKYFSSARLGIAPDPATAFNTHSTHNKIMEYMIFSLPVVAFNLKETKKSAQDAVLVIEQNADPHAFGDGILRLIDDQILSNEMGNFGRKRVLENLAWDTQRDKYTGAISRAYKESKRGKTEHE